MIKKLVHEQHGSTEYFFWKIESTEEEKKKLLDYVFKRKPAKVGRYSFKKPPTKTKLADNKVNLNNLIPEMVCKHCGRTFCLHYGQRLKDYRYKAREKGSVKNIYFCSWNCYSKWQKDNKLADKRLTKEI